jgi:hypothetical protein
MKRYEFYYDPQIPGVDPITELIEVDDDTIEADIEEIFTDWIFNHIDAGYREISSGEE